MIHTCSEKIKAWLEAHQNDLFLIAVIALLSVIFFGAGRLWLAGFYEPARRARPNASGGRAGGIEFRKIIIEENAFSILSPSTAIKNFVASINGEKYYPAGCKAGNRIKEENRIWFSSGKDARDMGYTPSSQCEK